ncbi:MAG: signal peptidase I [Thermoflexales bacterium]|nr:signal peptidase I [Thermoflexales bacterium]
MEPLTQEHKPSLISSAWRLAGRLVWELVAATVPAVLLAMVINVYIAEAAVIDGPSMQPNLYTGYRVMTEKLSYHLHTPQRGDVVVIDMGQGQIPLIKRVVGLPGEIVQVRAGHTYINGELLDEPWVSYFGGPDYPPTRIDGGYLFIMGDNRRNSHDSRALGPVSLDRIKRRALFVYWPLTQFKPVP